MQVIATNFMARAIRPALAVALCLCVSVTADAGNGFIVVDLDGNSQDGSVALSRADDGTLLVLANSASDPSSLVAHGILAFAPCRASRQQLWLKRVCIPGTTPRLSHWPIALTACWSRREDPLASLVGPRGRFRSWSRCRRIAPGREPCSARPWRLWTTTV